MLVTLLRRAGFDADACIEMCGGIAKLERDELSRAFGRIEPRNRFPNLGSHPALLSLPVSVLTIDECGRSEPQSTARQPVFSLGAVAFDEEDIDNYRAEANILKNRFFGTTAITLHEPGVRNHDGIYWFDGDTQRQRAFDEELGALIRRSKFVGFGAAVRKDAFHRDFAEQGTDPYLPTDVYSLAITLLMERYVDFLAMSGRKRPGRVIFESQGPKEDALHQLEYARLLVEGTQWVPESAFRNWVEPGVRFCPKQGSDPGELADLLARDVYEWAKSGCQDSPKWWAEFSPKTYLRGDGAMGKFGVKVFPDSDIRERVEEHRHWVSSRTGN